MARPAPQDPELLAATIAALRVAAGGTPRNEFERAVGERARKGGGEPSVAASVTGRFDRLNEGMRRSALGPWLDRPPQRQPLLAEATGTGTVRDHRGRDGARVADADGSATVRDHRRGGAAGAGGVSVASGGDVRGRRIGLPDDWLDRLDDLIATAPTYSVTYQGLVCEAETSWDRFSNSDEVYAISLATHFDADGQNYTNALTHPVDRKVYDDIDKQEERIGPVAACWSGVHLPVSLSVVAFEHDEGDPDAYRDELKAIVAAAAAVIGYLYAPGVAAKALITALSPLIVDALNWLFDTEDDQIGPAHIEVLDQARFEELGRREPSPYVYTAPFFGGVRTLNTNLYGHFFSHHSGEGARYVFGFQVERDPAFKVETGPFL